MPEKLKSWIELFDLIRNRIDTPYYWGTSVLAVITMVAVLTDKTPVHVAADVIDWLGLREASDWLLSSPAPYLTGGGEVVFLSANFLLATIAGLFFLAPLVRGRLLTDDVVLWSWRQIGSRAAATFWIVAAVSAQSGSLRLVLSEASSIVFEYMLAFLILATALAIVVSQVGRALNFDSQVISVPIWELWRRATGSVLASFTFSLISLGWVALYVPTVVGSWLLSFTAVKHVRADVQPVEREPIASGARVVKAGPSPLTHS